MTNSPIETFKDGSLKATIWKNDAEKGAFYSVTLSRFYTEGDQFKENNSFSGSEPLRIANLAQQAHNFILKQREADKAAQNSDEQRAA